MKHFAPSVFLCMRRGLVGLAVVEVAKGCAWPRRICCQRFGELEGLLFCTFENICGCSTDDERQIPYRDLYPFEYASESVPFRTVAIVLDTNSVELGTRIRYCIQQSWV